MYCLKSKTSKTTLNRISALMTVLLISGSFSSPGYAQNYVYRTFLDIEYENQRIYRDDLIDGRSYLLTIASPFNIASYRLVQEYGPILENAVSSYNADVDYFRVDVVPEFDINFEGDPGGVVTLDITGPSVRVTSKISHFLADAYISASLERFTATANYNLYTGELSAMVVEDPDFDFSVNESLSFPGSLLAFLTGGVLGGGYIASYLSDLVSDFESETEDMVQQAISARLSGAAFSTTVFGLDEIIPSGLTYNGVAVSNTIRDLLSDPIDGQFVSISFSRSGFGALDLIVGLGDDIVIALDGVAIPAGGPR